MAIIDTSGLVGAGWTPGQIDDLLHGVRQQIDAVGSSAREAIDIALSTCGVHCAEVRASWEQAVSETTNQVSATLRSMPGVLDAAVIRSLAYAITYGQELGIPDPDWLTSGQTDTVATPEPPAAPPTSPDGSGGQTASLPAYSATGPVVATADGQLAQPPAPVLPTVQGCPVGPRFAGENDIAYSGRIAACAADQVYLTKTQIAAVGQPYGFTDYEIRDHFTYWQVFNGGSIGAFNAYLNLWHDLPSGRTCPNVFALKPGSAIDPAAAAADLRRQWCDPVAQPPPPTPPPATPPATPAPATPPASQPGVCCPDQTVICSDQAWLESADSSDFRDRLRGLFPAAVGILEGSSLTDALVTWAALIPSIQTGSNNNGRTDLRITG